MLVTMPADFAQNSATLRASVTTSGAAGAAVSVLVDGADTAVTANGLPDYAPNIGDRVLVQQVGGNVEILQVFSGTYTGPTITGGTIVGALIETATSGARVTMSNDAANGLIKFYNGDTGEAAGLITSGTNSLVLTSIHHPVDIGSASLTLQGGPVGNAKVQIGNILQTDKIAELNTGNGVTVQQKLIPSAGISSDGSALDFVNEWYSSASIANIANTTFTIVTGWGATANGAFYTDVPGTDGTAGQFTVQKAGTYMIVATVNFSANATGRRIAAIYRNGTEVRRTDQGASPSTQSVQVTHVQHFAVGDTFDVRAYQSSGAGLAMNASPGHDINIVRLGA